MKSPSRARCGIIWFIILMGARMTTMYPAQQGKRLNQAAKQEFIRQKREQREERRVRNKVQAQVAKAKHNVDRAQEEIDHAIALSLQEQEQQRVLQESAQEVQEAAAKLQQALTMTSQQKKAVPQAKKLTLPVDTIKPMRVHVVQQQGTECGYWAALDAVIVFNALKLGLPAVLQDAAALLRDEKRMRAYLQEMQDVLARLPHRYDMSLFALDEGAIADIMTHYAHMSIDDYSMFSMPLPYTVGDLPRFQEGIIDIIKHLKRTPQATHVFFLRSGSDSTKVIGHWIAVVAHNNGTQLMCYIIDSLRSLGHDDTWQRLVQLITEV